MKFEFKPRHESAGELAHELGGIIRKGLEITSQYVPYEEKVTQLENAALEIKKDSTYDPVTACLELARETASKPGHIRELGGLDHPIDILEAAARLEKDIPHHRQQVTLRTRLGVIQTLETTMAKENKNPENTAHYHRAQEIKTVLSSWDMIVKEIGDLKREDSYTS